MSVKKTLSLTRWETKKKTAMATTAKVKKARSLSSSSPDTSEVNGDSKKKKLRMDISITRRFFPFMREVSIEPEGARSLKDVDSGKLKAEIVRWAKRVASYARQVSGKIGRSMTMNSRTLSSDVGNGQ